MLKKTLITIITTGLTCAAITANAGTLEVYNYTNQDSTTKTRGALLCSSQILGSYGVTPHKQPNGQPGRSTTSENMLKIACGRAAESCVADVYMTNNCSGPVVATATFSVTKGLISIQRTDPAYDFSQSSGFNIIVTGGH